MKNLKVITAILTMAFVSLITMSCKDNKKEDVDKDTMHNEMTKEVVHQHEGMESDMNHESMVNTVGNNDSSMQSSNTKEILVDYMQLKDALVSDSQSKAATAGSKLEATLNGFDLNQYTKDQQIALKDIIDDAKEHAEHIGKSELAHQREHFKSLSIDIMDMVAITGTPNTVYQQYCPMYDKGSSWLSMSKDIKNPFYGSKMLTCGSVKKQFN